MLILYNIQKAESHLKNKNVWHKIKKQIIYAPVAQLDRAFGYEPKGREFESLRA